jgi:ABC-type methionine transport system ATPase subunit
MFVKSSPLAAYSNRDAKSRKYKASRFMRNGVIMATKRIKLTFPQELIKEPLIFTMAKKFDVMPNIRRARVTESVGEVVLELEGAVKNLDDGIAFLEEHGVKVEAAEGDILST